VERGLRPCPPAKSQAGPQDIINKEEKNNKIKI
jgi:hypothetical protein